MTDELLGLVAEAVRNLRDELDRLHLVTLATGAGTVTQRGELTAGQRTILTALELPEPPRFYDFTPPPTDHGPPPSGTVE